MRFNLAFYPLPYGRGSVFIGLRGHIAKCADQIRATH